VRAGCRFESVSANGQGWPLRGPLESLGMEDKKTGLTGAIGGMRAPGREGKMEIPA